MTHEGELRICYHSVANLPSKWCDFSNTDSSTLDSRHLQIEVLSHLPWSFLHYQWGISRCRPVHNIRVSSREWIYWVRNHICWMLKSWFMKGLKFNFYLTICRLYSSRFMISISRQKSSRSRSDACPWRRFTATWNKFIKLTLSFQRLLRLRLSLNLNANELRYYD